MAAAASAKAAKKNIWNAIELRPVAAMSAVTPSFLTPALTISTHRLPMVTARYHKLMMVPFMDAGAWLYANSSPEVDTSTSPNVSRV